MALSVFQSISSFISLNPSMTIHTVALKKKKEAQVFHFSRVYSKLGDEARGLGGNRYGVGDVSMNSGF